MQPTITDPEQRRGPYLISLGDRELRATRHLREVASYDLAETIAINLQKKYPQAPVILVENSHGLIGYVLEPSFRQELVRRGLIRG